MGKIAGRSVGPAGSQLPVEQLAGQDPLLQQALQEQQEPAAPAAEPTQEVPQAPPVQSGYIDQAQADVIYDEQAQLVEEQERERVPSIQERRDNPEQMVRYNPLSDFAQADTTIDGGLFERSRELAKDVQAKRLIVPTKQKGDEGQYSGPLTNVVNNIGAVKFDEQQEGGLDPAFAQIGALVTENTIAELSAGGTVFGVDPDTGEQIVEETGERVQDPDELIPSQAEFARESGNERLGKEIAREWKRYKNKQEGRPTDEYEDISREEANVLGDAFKTMWARQNPHLINRVNQNDKVYYQLTPEGVSMLKDGSAARKKLFPRQTVRPSKNPIPGGVLRGEQGRITSRVSGQKGKQGGRRIVQEAMENLSTVPNVVDSQRERIALATILPALGAQVELAPEVADAFAEIHSIGPGKFSEFAATYDRKTRDGEEADTPADAMQKYKQTVAQQVLGVAMEREGANYLSYYLQAFNGRIAPQQSVFDPTSGKYTRFVTRNAVPAMAKPGSRIEKNLEQMYAMMLVPGADVVLPQERVRMLEAHSSQMEQWGNRLATLLDQSVSEADAQAISEAIQQGIAVDNPNFPQVKPLALDPSQDADLIAAIRKKGEDGPHFIDGLIDYAKFAKWKRDQKDPKKPSRPFGTYFNAYIDGKTNGLASNGIQMGSYEVAAATGVIRSNQTRLLDEGDIRDQLKDNLLESISNNGWHGLKADLEGPMNYVAQQVYSIRNLNKATTMTFGYGKDVQGFRFDIDEYMSIEMQNNPDLAAAVAKLDDAIGRDVLIDSLLNQYIGSLEQVLSDDTLESRDLMQGSALISAMVDAPLTMKGPMGFDLVFGGDVVNQVTQDDRQTYSIYTQGKPMSIAVDQAFIDFRSQQNKDFRQTDERQQDTRTDDKRLRDADKELIDYNVGSLGLGTPSTDKYAYDYVDHQGNTVDVKMMERNQNTFRFKTDTIQKYQNNPTKMPDFFEFWVQEKWPNRALQVGDKVDLTLKGRLSQEQFFQVLEPVPNPPAGSPYVYWLNPSKLKEVLKSDELVRHKEGTNVYQKRQTAAAPDDTRGIGGKAYGGSIPGPIQSIDAATVAKTASGKSWDKLKQRSGGNPYLHTIYDAFKMDAMGYDTVLEEVNKNWLDSAMDWSYLRETQKSVKESVNAWNMRFNELGQAKDTYQSAAPGSEFQMVGDLFFKKPNAEGKLTHGRLYKMMGKFNPNITKDMSEEAKLEAVSSSVNRIIKDVEAARPPGARPQEQVMTPRMVKAFIKAFIDETKINSRLDSLTIKTDNKKKQLRSEIARSGPVYQYYAH